MNITQLKGIGYEVNMTGMETKRFGFEGLEVEFKIWLETINNNIENPILSPEEALKDLLIVEAMCHTKL